MNKLSFFITIIVILILSSSCNRKMRYIYKEDHKQDSIISYNISSEPYRLKSNDVLHIKITTIDPSINELFRIDEQTNDLNRNVNGGNFYLTGFNVNDTGFVKVPILGTLNAKGKTVQEFRSLVTSKTHEYLKDAIVNVKLVSFKISFLGEVQEKGPIFIYQDNIDILEAVARAGGITEYGNMREVTVIRKENDKRLVYKLDLTERELLRSNKFYLYPDDMIIVDPVKAKMARINLQDYMFFFSAVTTALSTTVLILNLVSK